MKQAFVTLLSVIITGFVSVTIIITLLALGVGSSKTSFTLERSALAQSAANACAEEALSRIRESSTFEGGGDLTLEKSMCNYDVIRQAGDDREIRATGTAGATVRRVKVTISAIMPRLIISSWQELADF